MTKRSKVSGDLRRSFRPDHHGRIKVEERAVSADGRYKRGGHALLYVEWSISWTDFQRSERDTRMIARWRAELDDVVRRYLGRPRGELCDFERRLCRAYRSLQTMELGYPPWAADDVLAPLLDVTVTQRLLDTLAGDDWPITVDES